MAENLAKKPAKGILRTSSSFEHSDARRQSHQDIKWDEMNILQTLHPADKDYGHMKIEEPKTPYRYDDMDNGDEQDSIDASLLAEKIQLGCSHPPKVLQEDPESSSEEEEEMLTEEEKERRRSFETKRKKHYNEFLAVKLARKLIEDEDEEEEEEEEESKQNCSKTTSKEPSTAPGNP